MSAKRQYLEVACCSRTELGGDLDVWPLVVTHTWVRVFAIMLLLLITFAVTPALMNLKYESTYDASDFDLSTRLLKIQDNAESNPVVGVSIDEVNPGDRTISGQLRVLLPLKSGRLKIDSTGQSILGREDVLFGKYGSEFEKLKTSEANLRVTWNSTSVDYPLLDSTESTMGLSTSIVFRAAYGAPSNFPEDTYDIIGSPTIDLPKGVSWNDSTQIEARPVWIASHSLSDWKIYDSCSEGFLVSCKGNVARTRTFKLFVYGVAGIPFLLILAYVAVARTGSRGDQEVTSPLELAAALLALLTLRQVLIPADVPGITFLDRVLGLEVVAMIVVLIFRYGRNSMASAVPEQRSGESKSVPRRPIERHPGSRSRRRIAGHRNRHPRGESLE